jgi:uncharacterized membrane protein
MSARSSDLEIFMPTRSAGLRANRSSRSFSLLSGLLFGIGVASFVDETVFHQLLHWHHFYDRSTPTAGLISDGLFHAFGFFCTVGGLFLLADVRRRAVVDRQRWWAGLLLGLGGFQLYDGTIQHKLLHLHQIRYHVEIWPYDLTWNLVAAVALLIGLVLLLRTRRQSISPERAV